MLLRYTLLPVHFQFEANCGDLLLEFKQGRSRAAGDYLPTFVGMINGHMCNDNTRRSYQGYNKLSLEELARMASLNNLGPCDTKEEYRIALMTHDEERLQSDPWFE